MTNFIEVQVQNTKGLTRHIIKVPHVHKFKSKIS